MTEQLDMFPAPTSAVLVGLKVKLDRPTDRANPCCNNVCVIRAGKGPHAGALHCIVCSKFRRWLSKSTAQWIESVITRFGAPATPIVVAQAHLSRLPAVVGADSGRNANAPEQESTKMDMSQYAGQPQESILVDPISPPLQTKAAVKPQAQQQKRGSPRDDLEEKIPF